VSKVLTVCPFCGCGCGVVLDVENDQVLSAHPQRAHPVSRGTLCVKGWNGHQIIHSPERLTRPMIRKNGGLEPASWNEALDLVAQKLGDVKSASGANAIGVVGSIKCTNEENYLLGKFVRTVIGTNNIDTSARFYQAATFLALNDALGAGAAQSSILQLEKAEAILIFGENAKSQLARIGSYLLQAVKNNGAKAILIDPHLQDHSRFATFQLRPKPGTDYTIINSLIHIIITNGWYDDSVKNVESLKKRVEQFTPEYCEKITGIPLADLTRAAELFATTSNGMILYGTGITQQANAKAVLQSLWNLALLTGNLGKQGSGILPLMFSNNMQGAIDMGLAPELLPGHSFVENSDAISYWESAWHCTLPTTPGKSLQEMIDAAGQDIKAMYVIGENLAWSAPDSEKAVESLKKLDFLVVQDLFLTPTAQLADVVLPAASYAEKEGTFTNTERRIQKVNKALPAIKECRTDAEIIAELANRMGGSFHYDNSEKIFAELSELVPQYKGITYNELSVPGGKQWPVNGNSEGILTATSAGKESFVFVDVEEPQAAGEIPDDEYPFTLIVGRIPFHRITGTLNSRSFTLAKEFPAGIVEINTDDARQLKVRSGWQVKIKTRRGEIVRTIVATRNVPQKTIFVPIHHKDGLTQSLMPADLDPVTKTPMMKTCAAKLEIIS